MQDFLDYVSTTPLRTVAPPLWYPTVIPGTPDLLVVRIPELMAQQRKDGPDTLNRYYKVVFAETVGDQTYLNGCLDKPLPVAGNTVSFRLSIDKTNLRPSAFPFDGEIKLLHYGPSADGWPHLAVVMLSENTDGLRLCRLRYQWFAFATEQEAMARLRFIRSH
jgi:hypothetical protein